MNHFILMIVLYCNYGIFNKAMMAIVNTNNEGISIQFEVTVSCILIPFLIF